MTAGTLKLPETTLRCSSCTCLWTRWEHVNWVFWKERQTPDQWCAFKKCSYFPSGSSTVLGNSMRIARAQGAALGVAARAAAFPVRAVAQVPTQLERSDSISLAALINRVHFQKLFSLRRWNSLGTGGIASVTHHN